MEIKRLVFASGFAILMSTGCRDHSPTKLVKPEVLITVGGKKKVDLSLQLSD